MSHGHLEMYLETDMEMEAGPYRRLDLIHSNGYVPQEINLGFPDIRDNVQKRPSANGTFDFTRYFAASAVQIKVAMEPSLMATPVTTRRLEDQLKRWLNPARRSCLVYRDPGEEDWRRIRVRGNDSTRNISLARTTFGVVSLVFRAPKGYSESLEVFSKNLPFTGTESGRAYDLTFDRTYPASGTIGVIEVENLGNVESHPILRIYGPCSDFRVENQTTGEQLKFKTAFSLLANEFLVIDMENGTVLMNGDVGNDRYDQIDVATSDWWTLQEGMNLIRAVAGTYTSPEAHGEIYGRHNYI